MVRIVDGVWERVSVVRMIEDGPTRTLGVHIRTGDEVQWRKSNTFDVL